METPTTIRDLFSEDRRLGLICNYCGRFRYLNQARFELDTDIRTIAQGMACARCGSRDVETFAVSRHPRNGYWPAERS
ncbi:hypothetical protein [Roseibium aestuarii]|uniref:Uncharacterized protein n=1 Tax=Roseibium aestuarii TaxID=2600299 RepID=A0ABW4JQJ2_9HYPH|nr:hypothetical protein [Roseibium aestuarii]